MSKKRKHDQVEPDAFPAADDGPDPDSSKPAKVQKLKSKSKGQSRQEKSERRAKKNKTGTKADGLNKSKRNVDLLVEDAEKIPEKYNEKSVMQDEGAKLKPSKKEKVKKASSKKQLKDDINSNTNTEFKSKSNSEAEPDKSATRFIVFVGNLPFTATAAQVQEHFVKIAPSAVRLSTDKATGKGKGFAFVEFDGYDKMKTCLKLYHHSIFDPEAKGKDKTNKEPDDNGNDDGNGKRRGRRINVELTAGGGGKKSKDRRERIKSKNIKLDEERERTRVKERAEQDEAARKKRSQPQTGPNAAPKDNGAIHPSRLAQMRH